MGTIAKEVLESLLPLSQLPPEAVEALASEAEIEEVAARQVIFRKGGNDGWMRYVLSGAVLLADDDGNRWTVTGTGDAGVAPEPLADRVPYPVHALAGTDVRLIRLPTSRLTEQLEAARLPGYQVGEVDVSATDDPGEGLFYRLFQDLMEERLELPSMPDVAVRVRSVAAQEDASPADLARIIQSDPVVAARVIQAANAARFAAQGQVDALSPAIVRLGLRATGEIVTAAALKRVFQSDNGLIHKRLTELWMHSSMIAATAQVLARRLHGFDADRALLAGLVHDLGVIPMLVHAEHYPELASNPARLEETIDAYRGQVGAMILRRWNFPDDMVAVPLEAENWHREVAQPDYADVVMVSQLQALGGFDDSLPALREIPACERLDLEALGLTDGDSLLAEAREEIAEAQKLLVG